MVVMEVMRVLRVVVDLEVVVVVLRVVVDLEVVVVVLRVVVVGSGSGSGSGGDKSDADIEGGSVGDGAADDHTLDQV